jgi:hypothetical protein
MDCGVSDLEKVLFLWQQQIEERGGVTSGELLRQKTITNLAPITSIYNTPLPRIEHRLASKLQETTSYPRISSARGFSVCS